MGWQEGWAGRSPIPLHAPQVGSGQCKRRETSASIGWWYGQQMNHDFRSRRGSKVVVQLGVGSSRRRPVLLSRLGMTLQRYPSQTSSPALR